MKFDPLLAALALLHLKSTIALNTCNTIPNSPIRYRLCVEIGKDGLLQARMVTCKRNEFCDDPEYYPCEVQWTDEPQRTEEIVTTDSSSAMPASNSKNSNNSFQNPFVFAHILSVTTATLVEIVGRTETENVTTIGSEQDETPVTSTETTLNLQQPCNASKKYPGPLCNEYYICILTSNEKYLLQTCPQNLIFDEKTEECRSGDSPNCTKSRPNGSANSTSTSSTGSTLLSTSNQSLEVTTAGTIVTDSTDIGTTPFSNFSPFVPLISSANVILTALTTILIIISSFILIDFIL